MTLNQVRNIYTIALLVAIASFLMLFVVDGLLKTFVNLINTISIIAGVFFLFVSFFVAEKEDSDENKSSPENDSQPWE